MKGQFVKTFESYVNEVSKTKWDKLERHFRGRNLGGFADRIRKHSEEYGETPTIDVVIQRLGYDTREEEVTLTDLVVFDSSMKYFQIEAKTVEAEPKRIYLEGSVEGGSTLMIFTNGGNDQVMFARARDAAEFIQMLMRSSKVDIQNPKIAMRSICLEYAQFRNSN
jgi:hypothetical protein